MNICPEFEELFEELMDLVNMHWDKDERRGQEKSYLKEIATITPESGAEYYCQLRTPADLAYAMTSLDYYFTVPQEKYLASVAQEGTDNLRPAESMPPLITLMDKDDAEELLAEPSSRLIAAIKKINPTFFLKAVTLLFLLKEQNSNNQ